VGEDTEKRRGRTAGLMGHPVPKPSAASSKLSKTKPRSPRGKRGKLVPPRGIEPLSTEKAKSLIGRGLS
jgi:hypothetical protein